jgi:hypothetical protein
MSVELELKKFGDYIKKQSRTNLTKKKKNDTKGLYNSIDYKLEVSKNSFSLSFVMDEHGKFIDKGVKGVSSSRKAPQSPYKFGTGTGKKGGLTNGIDNWVKRKRIQFKDRKSGRFMSYKSTAFLIRNSIWNKGLETTNFFTKPFEAAFKRLPDTLVEAFGLEVDNLLNFTTKK